MRMLSTGSLLLAAMLAACATTAVNITRPADPVAAQATASVAAPVTPRTTDTDKAALPPPPAAAPPSVVCPGASRLEAQTLACAPHGVAATVGIIGASAKGVASGSGVVVSADGLIVTAGHVVDAPGTPLTIRFPDGRVARGTALGVDRGADSGLAKIIDAPPPGGWPFAPMAPADSAQNGEWVLATGNPGGVVLGRNPPLRLGRITIHTDKLIQSDCTVVSGDSGGPLFDLEGRVVGINSNISLSTDENHHVPISVYHAQWTDLLAGKNIQSKGGMLDRSPRPQRVPAPPAPAPADAGKITNLMEALRRLAAGGDAEAKKLLDQSAKDGKLALPESDVKRLMEAANKLPAIKPKAGEQGVPRAYRAMLREGLRNNLLKQFPGAFLTDAILDRIFDKSSFDPATGRLDAHPDMHDLKAMGMSSEQMARNAGVSQQTARVSQRLGETSLQALSLFAPALDAAGSCIVEIYGDGRPILMGTVVDADGWVVTKASALLGKTTVILDDGTPLEAKMVGKDEATDMALLKVDAKARGRKLEAARLSEVAPLGSWLVSPVRDPNRPAVGVVSVAARPIPEMFTHFYGEQKIMLGLAPRDEKSTVVGEVAPNLPADKAGVKAGDEVLAINGQPAKDWMGLVDRIRALKPGDTAILKVRRAGKELELKALLGEAKVSSATHDSIGEADALAGGRLSLRRTRFPAAIQHDAVVWADQCGGPLIDLKGQTVGINIARYDRVCTFAIPAKQVKETVAKLRAEAAKPVAAPVPAPAPAAVAPAVPGTK